MGWKTLDDMDLAGKRVLVRVDINVPVEDGRVTDATRIERIVPTVKDILAKGGKPILMAHFDRPKGKVVPEMSLRVTLPALVAALGQPVTFVDGQYGGRWPRWGRAMCCSSKTSASIRARKRTTRSLRPVWPRLATSTATTPSLLRTAPMPRPRRLPGCCPLARAA
jgi:hypothetical protein